MSVIEPLETVFGRGTWQLRAPVTAVNLIPTILRILPAYEFGITNAEATSRKTHSFSDPGYYSAYIVNPSSVYDGPLITRQDLKDHYFGAVYINDFVDKFYQSEDDFDNDRYSLSYRTSRITWHIFRGGGSQEPKGGMWIPVDPYLTEFTRDFWGSDEVPGYPLTNNLLVADAFPTVPPWLLGPPLGPDSNDDSGGSERPDYGLLYPRKV